MDGKVLSIPEKFRKKYWASFHDSPCGKALRSRFKKICHWDNYQYGRINDSNGRYHDVYDYCIAMRIYRYPDKDRKNSPGKISTELYIMEEKTQKKYGAELFLKLKNDQENIKAEIESKIEGNIHNQIEFRPEESSLPYKNNYKIILSEIFDPSNYNAQHKWFCRTFNAFDEVLTHRLNKALEELGETSNEDS